MTDADAQATRECLLRVGAALLAGTAPGPDVERQVIAIGQRLGVPDVRAAATVTGLFLSTTSDHAVVFEPVGGTLRFEQMSLVQDVIDRLLAGRLAPAEAVPELAAIEALPPSRPDWVNDLAIVPIAVGICAILQPTWRDLGAAALGSLAVVALVIIGRRSPLVATLLPLAAAFAVTSIVLQFAMWWPLEGTMRTVVSTIAVLLPGAMIVTGMSEIASGAAVSGTSRLVSGTVQLLLFAVGMFAAVAVRGDALGVLTNVRANDLGPGAPFGGIAVLGAGMVINVAAHWRDVPWILGVLFLTFVVAVRRAVALGSATRGVRGRDRGRAVGVRRAPALWASAAPRGLPAGVLATRAREPGPVEHGSTRGRGGRPLERHRDHGRDGVDRRRHPRGLRRRPRFGAPPGSAPALSDALTNGDWRRPSEAFSVTTWRGTSARRRSGCGN